jgi:uncharacterized protein YutE (UPF0331/DUF86 family)
MKDLKLKRGTILDRIGVIKNSLRKLEDLKSLPLNKFLDGENFAIAEHYLRYALKATFDICAHVLSRIPGAMVDEYKKMAMEMGRQKIVPMDFAEENLYKMAGYRNRLTHFYFEISPKEMHEIIQNKLSDFRALLKYFKKLLEKQ